MSILEVDYSLASIIVLVSIWQKRYVVNLADSA
jgi:hypothetical protein